MYPSLDHLKDKKNNLSNQKNAKIYPNLPTNNGSFNQNDRNLTEIKDNSIKKIFISLFLGYQLFQIAYCIFLIKNLSLNKIFNFKNFYSLDATKYHLKILFAAFSFALLLTFFNLLNFIGKNKEGELTSFFLLFPDMQLGAQIAFNALPNFIQKAVNESIPEVFNKSSLLQKSITIASYQQNEKDQKFFLKQVAKLNFSRFLIIFIKMFIVFEILLFLNFVCKRYLSSNIIDNVFMGINILLISIALINIFVDIFGYFSNMKSFNGNLDEYYEQNTFIDYSNKSIKFINETFESINNSFLVCKINEVIFYPLNQIASFKNHHERVQIPKLFEFKDSLGLDVVNSINVAEAAQL